MCKLRADTPKLIYLLRVLLRVKSDVPAVIVSKFTRAIVGTLVTGKQRSNVLQYHGTIHTYTQDERSQ